ncbi:MAG: hypothetical protein NZ990_06715 [Myxococcota bacterium]|nr:hypothetical protein [Myxococcota bacterium]
MVWPNLGAEEGSAWPQRTELPRVAATLRLWRHLLGASQGLLLPTGAPAAPSEDWPETLGPRPGDPVFEWLAGRPAVCWLADEEARLALEAAGVSCPGPAPEIVRQVHDKAFAATSADAAGYAPGCLAGLCITYSPDDLADPARWVEALGAQLKGWPEWTRGRFTLKPRIGSSGRGRVGGRSEALESEKIRAALPRLARQGGAVLEPWLRREADLSAMLHIAEPGAPGSGGVTLLGTAEQRLAPSGVYLGHLGEIDSRGRVFSAGPWEEAMREAAGAMASEARRAGYWGPCGIDGFTFRGPDAPAPILRPVVEFNARFTVGIVVVGLIRRALAQIRGPLALEPGERRGFLFALDPPPGFASWEAVAEAAGSDSHLVTLGSPGEGDPPPARPALLFARSADALRAALDSSNPGAD